MTGSVARGDASLGSDLDLWVVGDARGRVNLRASGVPVTLLCQSLEEAISFESLCLFEVPDLLVLVDPGRRFARIRRAYARRLGAIRASILESTWRDLGRLWSLVEGASAAQRVVALREIAHRLAAIRIFLDTGRRVPRWRSFSTLPLPLRRALDAASDLQGTRGAALGALREIEAARRQVRRALPDLGVAKIPRELRARVAAREWPEAEHGARRWLLLELLTPALRELTMADLGALRLVPTLRPIYRAVAAIHRIPAPPAKAEALARKVAGATAALARDRTVRRALPPGLSEQLATLARPQGVGSSA